MFINKIPLFVTISRDIKFCTSKVIRDMKNHALYNAIKQVIRIYHSLGFKVTQFLMDGQFKSLQANMRELNVIHPTMNMCPKSNGTSDH